MEWTVAGIPVAVQRKNIKNAHLYVKPPDGHVSVSAPLAMKDKAVELFIRTNIDWIKKQIRRFHEQPRADKRQYVSGETLYLWGKQYFLQFEPSTRKNALVFEGKRAILRMRAASTVQQRERYVREQYREALKKEIRRLLPKWEQTTGLRAAEWRTKYMTTKWGICKAEAGRLWFNVQLAEKPPTCLEYVILHELLHLVERRHNERFVAQMDKYMPRWQEIRKVLNEARLDWIHRQ